MNPLQEDLQTIVVEPSQKLEAEMMDREILDTDWPCILRVGGLAITGVTVCLVFYYLV